MDDHLIAKFKGGFHIPVQLNFSLAFAFTDHFLHFESVSILGFHNTHSFPVLSLPLKLLLPFKKKEKEKKKAFWAHLYLTNMLYLTGAKHGAKNFPEVN